MVLDAQPRPDHHRRSARRFATALTSQGPLEIGSDCLIGNLAIVRGPARIGNGTRIGFATEIKNAIIDERVTIGPQCFVADSKIESEAYLGAQVRTSNHRLDKATVKVMVDGEAVDTGLEKLGCLIGARSALGIQVIILPGRIIAPGLDLRAAHHDRKEPSGGPIPAGSTTRILLTGGHAMRLHYCAPLALAFASSAQAATPPNLTKVAAGPNLSKVVASVDGEYLSYSGPFGSRRIVNARSTLDVGRHQIVFRFSARLAQGRRRQVQSRARLGRGCA